MNERDRYLLKQAYAAGYLNASLKMENGGDPLSDFPDDEASDWIDEVIADNGGTTGQYICSCAPESK